MRLKKDNNLDETSCILAKYCSKKNGCIELHKNCWRGVFLNTHYISGQEICSLTYQIYLFKII